MAEYFMNPKLIDEIKIELDSLGIIVNDVEFLLKEVGDYTPNNIYKTALGGFASQFYNGIENILKRVHKYLAIELPKGDDWHIVMLDRFSENSNYDIPFKFSKELIISLTDYRRFRHYFFHGYSHNLNWEILKNGAQDISIVYEKLKKEIGIF